MWFKVGHGGVQVAKDDTSRLDELGIGGFVGEFTHSLDSKKRMTIPSDWREMAGVPQRLFVLPAINNKCLCVYPARDMARRLERLRNLSMADTEGRQLARTLASRSDLVSWDSQGRIRIKDHLLDRAQINNQVVLVGAFETFELWNPDLYREAMSSVDESSLGDVARRAGF